MRILCVHNFMRSSQPCGEDRVLESEMQMLARAGHTVELHARRNDDLLRLGRAGELLAGLQCAANPRAWAQLRARLAAFAPDVVHLHSTFPQLSPLAHWAPHRAGVPQVTTLHNYRVYCPIGIALRDGAPCFDCVTQGSVLPALRHGCYRGSRIATAPLAASVALHRALRTWQRCVDAFILLNPGQRDTLAAAGLPAQRMHLKPNFLDTPLAPAPWDARAGVLFVGRLSEEKGVRVLARAWCDWGPQAPPLTVIGDGPLRGEIEPALRAAGAPVTFLGLQTLEQVLPAMNRARLLVFPSTCHESQPRTIIEAFAHALPVAASNLSGPAALVDDGATGALFAAADPAALRRSVQALWDDPAALPRMSAAALQVHGERYSSAANIRQLEAVYESARRVRIGRSGGPFPQAA